VFRLYTSNVTVSTVVNLYAQSIAANGLWGALSQIYGDMLIGCIPNAMQSITSSSSTYSYRFNITRGNVIGGAWHGTDVQFWFNNDYSMGSKFSASEAKQAEQMAHTLTGFASHAPWDDSQQVLWYMDGGNELRNRTLTDRFCAKLWLPLFSS
jgi:carboxylesterase type B